MSPLPDDPPPGGSVGGANEEVLEAGADAKRLRTGRLRRDLLLAALILALIAAVARAMSHHNPSTAAPTTAPSLPSGRSAPDSGSGLLNGSVVNPSGTAQSDAQDPFACPASYQCLESAEAGPSAVSALHAAFPAAVLQSASTVRLLAPHLGLPLWFRQINARFGPNRILVRVQRQSASDVNRSGVANSEFGVITFYERPLNRYHVVVQVTTPKGQVEPLSPLQKLASDVRLLDLS